MSLLLLLSSSCYYRRKKEFFVCVKNPEFFMPLNSLTYRWINDIVCVWAASVCICIKMESPCSISFSELSDFFSFRRFFVWCIHWMKDSLCLALMYTLAHTSIQIEYRDLVEALGATHRLRLILKYFPISSTRTMEKWERDKAKRHFHSLTTRAHKYWMWTQASKQIVRA